MYETGTISLYRVIGMLQRIQQAIFATLYLILEFYALFIIIDHK